MTAFPQISMLPRMSSRMTLAALLFSLSALAVPLAHAQPADAPLYREFGEMPGLTQITHDLMTNLLADPRTKAYFEGTSRKRIESKLAEEFCVLLGGPCQYTGRPIKRTHEGLNIDRAAFNALVEDLQDAMDKNGVPFHTQNKLLAMLAPMYRDVEERN
jgi:hemoglobin